MEIEIMNKVVNHWKANEVLSNGNRNWSNRLLNEAHIKLPNDLIDLYRLSNGTSDYDEEGFLFYAYEELVTMGLKFSLETSNQLYNIVLFIDYMQESWWYGLKIKPNGYEIGIISASNNFKMISESLAEFFKLYLEDSEILYEYN
jgi:hypothetical protein